MFALVKLVVKEHIGRFLKQPYFHHSWLHELHIRHKARNLISQFQISIKRVEIAISQITCQCPKVMFNYELLRPEHDLTSLHRTMLIFFIVAFLYFYIVLLIQSSVSCFFFIITKHVDSWYSSEF